MFLDLLALQDQDSLSQLPGNLEVPQPEIVLDHARQVAAGILDPLAQGGAVVVAAAVEPDLDRVPQGSDHQPPQQQWDSQGSAILPPGMVTGSHDEIAPRFGERG